MDDALILFLAALIGYSFLRSFGGEGLTINFRLAPITTLRGKKDRAQLLVVFLVMMSAVTYVFLREDDNGYGSLIIVSLAMGILSAVIRYLNAKRMSGK